MCFAVGCIITCTPLPLQQTVSVGGNKSIVRRVQYQRVVLAFNYNTPLCINGNNKIITQGLPSAMVKGYKIRSCNPLLWVSGKIQLQPSEVGITTTFKLNNGLNV